MYEHSRACDDHSAGSQYLAATIPGNISMQELSSKNILIGVSGGIAAYKTADLVRRLRDTGAQVRVIMTRAAGEFITPLTLQALSGNPVHTELLDTAAEAAMGHIELARWADALLVAPASADLMARIAHGLGNDLLTTLILALDAPLALAPAMNQAMWRNAATQTNLEILQTRGVHLFGPANGSQACGDIGPGRMLEPRELVQSLEGLFSTGPLTGMRVAITAGPTREAIDPVRFISNHSSGKMGYALARAAAMAGAATTLISGPVALAVPDSVNFIGVTSATDMYQASMAAAQECDIFIATAAVADYRPRAVAAQKIKKSSAQMVLELERNPDIISAVASLTDKPFCVGFAAETQEVERYAREKMQRKGLDIIVANDVADMSIGFNSNYNQVTVITTDASTAVPRTTKTDLARLLITQIARQYRASRD